MCIEHDNIKQYASTHKYSMFCSLNCHGVNNSVEYICSFLSHNYCDFLSLQELWLIDSDLHKLNKLHYDYTYVATLGSVHKSRGDNVVCMWVQLKR